MSIALPVLAGHNGAGAAVNPWQKGHDKIKHSRAAKWRAASLIAVHVAIGVHVLLWLWRGRTLSPVEPSESMQTLREGIVNAGFVFFSLAILSTAILGRWFCGWGCHMIALQDLCSWIMTRMGIRPKPFRARLLLWVPLGLAIYMFVWPVLHREVLRPLLMDARGRLPWFWGQSDPLPGLTAGFVVKDFWGPFGPWWMAAPFALTCTFAVVYFLGSKGFCTYGCPYGGFFAPADRLALGKIRVTDACEGCGHCTAVCTSNVRVHEEVRDFGMVVDPGCMKCMDCVSVCPNDALYFGLGRPAVLAKPRNDAARETAKEAKKLRAARYDLKWYEEVAVLGLFVVFFYCFRGMLNLVPMLMADAMAGILAFCTWKVWSMRPVKWGGTPNMRLQSKQLRYRGRLTAGGRVLLAGTALGIALAAWGGYVKAERMAADYGYSTLRTPLNVALRPDYQATPEEVAAARSALAALHRSESVLSGGAGWRLTPDEEVNAAYMNVLLGDLDESLRRMERVIDYGHPKDSLISQIAALMQAKATRDAGGTLNPEQQGTLAAKIVALNERALALHPDLDGARLFLSGRTLQQGALTPGPGFTKAAIAAARAMWNGPSTEKAPRPETFISMARLELAIGGDDARARASKLAERADAAVHSHSADERLAVAGLFAQLGDRDRAISMAEEAPRKARGLGLPAVSSAGLLVSLDQGEKAGKLVEQGLARADEVGPHTGQLRTIANAAGVLVQLGRMDEALALFKRAAALATKAGDSAWDLYGIGLQVWQIGTTHPDGNFLLEGIKQLEAARDQAPDSAVIRHDLAGAYYSAERRQDAEREMRAAAELADTNAFLARRLSGLLAEMGKAQESVQWEAIAQRREQAAKPPKSPPADRLTPPLPPPPSR